MRIFAIRDDALPGKKTIGWLIYYEIQKVFYIELPDHADPWECPPTLSAFAERGENTINSGWSLHWVRRRIVPQDRQNLSQILRESRLKEYDEFSLLMRVKGRCEQDDIFLEEISELPATLINRWETKIEEIIPLEVPHMLVFFQNGKTKIVDIQALGIQTSEPFLVNQKRFSGAEIQPDGYGIWWNEKASILHNDLFLNGTEVPLPFLAFSSFIQNRVVTAAEACDLMYCSRQNIDELTRKGKLHPLREDAKCKLYLRNEILQRTKAD